MTVAVNEALSIIPYSSAHYEIFRDLNYAWISRYFEMEEADYRALNDPERYILQNDGHIFMAGHHGEIVGCCALIRINQRSYELAKMAVADKAQGNGIGYALGRACIDKAIALGIQKIELLSNTMLQPAIHLYKKLGFTEVELPETEYRRANIKMELNLQGLVKIAMVIAEELAPGFAVNSAAVLAASLSNKLPYLIGEDLVDTSGTNHTGLTWLPMPMLKAKKEEIKKIYHEAVQQKGLLVIDLSEIAQSARNYETYKAALETCDVNELQYCGVAIYGDKTTVNRLTRKLTLYR